MKKILLMAYFPSASVAVISNGKVEFNSLNIDLEAELEAHGRGLTADCLVVDDFKNDQNLRQQRMTEVKPIGIVELRAFNDTTDIHSLIEKLSSTTQPYPDIGDIAFIKESNDWIKYDSNEGTSYYIPQKYYRLKKQHKNGYIPKNNYRRSAQHRRTPKHSPFTGRYSISERRPCKIPIQRLQNNSCT